MSETESVPAVSPAALASESVPSEVSESAVMMDHETPAAPPQSKLQKKKSIHSTETRWMNENISLSYT